MIYIVHYCMFRFNILGLTLYMEKPARLPYFEIRQNTGREVPAGPISEEQVDLVRLLVICRLNTTHASFQEVCIINVLKKM